MESYPRGGGKPNEPHRPAAGNHDGEAKMMKVDNYFGGCPHCGGNDGYANVGRSHWFFCKAHKTSWCIGANLFSSWRDAASTTRSVWTSSPRSSHCHALTKDLSARRTRCPTTGKPCRRSENPDRWLGVYRARSLSRRGAVRKNSTLPVESGRAAETQS